MQEEIDIRKIKSIIEQKIAQASANAIFGEFKKASIFTSEIYVYSENKLLNLNTKNPNSQQFVFIILTDGPSNLLATITYFNKDHIEFISLQKDTFNILEIGKKIISKSEDEILQISIIEKSMFENNLLVFSHLENNIVLELTKETLRSLNFVKKLDEATIKIISNIHLKLKRNARKS